MELSGIDLQGGKSVEDKANELLKDNNLKEHVERKIEIFFEAIRDNSYIDDCIKNRTKTPEIRAKSILATGIGLLIAAYIANYILENYNRNEYSRELQRLIKYDWSRKNHIFRESGIVTADGKIVNSRATINKTKEDILINLEYKK